MYGKAMGLSLDELYQLLESGSVGDKELEELLAKLKKEMEKEFDQRLDKIDKEIANGVNGSNGNSAQASNGASGKGGTNGKDGKDGQDGDGVFIRYSEDSTGKNMTEKPTDLSKWMGTYVGANASTNPADYTWTRYSDATITYSDGTLYITQ